MPLVPMLIPSEIVIVLSSQLCPQHHSLPSRVGREFVNVHVARRQSLPVEGDRYLWLGKSSSENPTARSMDRARPGRFRLQPQMNRAWRMYLFQYSLFSCTLECCLAFPTDRAGLFLLIIHLKKETLYNRAFPCDQVIPVANRYFLNQNHFKIQLRQSMKAPPFRRVLA